MGMIIQGKPIQLEMYVLQKENGEEVCPFEQWYLALDKSIRVRIAKRLENVKQGNLGDHRWLDLGLLELKFTIGSGYRIYCGDADGQLVLLLTGGDKSTPI